MTTIRRFSSVAVVAAAVGLGAAAPALAQGTPVDLGLGYQYFRVVEENFVAGFNIDVDARVRSPLTVIGEVSFTRRGGDVDDEPGVEFSESATSFGGGVRYSYPIDDMRSVFGQVLVGVQRTAGTVTIDALDFDESESSNDFMLGLDGGVRFQVNQSVDAFVQAGIRRVFFEGEGETGFRIVVGVRLPLRR